VKNALYVDCCIRGAESRTRKLAQSFFSALGPEYEVERLYLPEENLAYFSGEYFAQRERLIAAGELDHPRFRYARQFAAADLIVMAAPFWDLSIPALLKVYIEQVSVDGITFQSGETGLKGLCRAAKLVFLTTRGGFYTDSPDEMGSRYLDALHAFFGIASYACVAADGMDAANFDAAASLKTACREAAELAKNL
jgi:FMN-dependent NADH-azoreductase